MSHVSINNSNSFLSSFFLFWDVAKCSSCSLINYLWLSFYSDIKKTFSSSFIYLSLSYFFYYMLLLLFMMENDERQQKKLFFEEIIDLKLNKNV